MGRNQIAVIIPLIYAVLKDLNNFTVATKFASSMWYISTYKRINQTLKNIEGYNNSKPSNVASFIHTSKNNHKIKQVLRFISDAK